jgi:hypothetical protein
MDRTVQEAAISSTVWRSERVIFQAGKWDWILRKSL